MLISSIDSRFISHALPSTETLDDLYGERARSIVGTLREREEACNTGCRVPDETIRDLKALGLFRLARPKRFGGVDADFHVTLRVAEELAQGCGSTAWVYGVLMIHDWFMKLWPTDVQEEVWSNDLDVLISSSLQPRPVRRVEGGYILNGDWPFSSGCDHAGWAQVGGLAEGISPRLIMVRISSGEIINDWRTLGLRGSGSKVLRFQEVFVPERFAVELSRVMLVEQRFSGTPTGSAWDDTPIVNSGDAFATVLMGLVQRGLGIVASGLRDRTSRGIKLSEVQLYQLRIGEVSSRLGMARFQLIEGSRALAHRLRSGEALPQAAVEQRASDVAVIVRQLREAVDLLSFCQTSWIYDTDPLQRIHRDVFTGATHFSGRWENFVAPHGKALMQGAQ